MNLSESQVIDCLRNTGVRREDVALGIGDDAALLNPAPGEQLVVCADAIVEGVHFPSGIAAGDIGWRVLAVNLSDFAAMAAEPRWATLSLTMPAADARWVRDFASGFAELANQFNIALIGGDTSRGPLNVCVNLLGTAPRESCLIRSAAAVGDGVFVTGHLGDAAAGLEIAAAGRAASSDDERTLLGRFLRPEPRVDFGRSLAGIASSAIDISDGLMKDAARLAQASKVGLSLQADQIPLSEALCVTKDAQTALKCALTGGDDYELLFTVGASQMGRLEALANSRNMSCTRIGTVIEGETVTYALEGKPWMPSYTSFEHFATGSLT